MSEELNLAACPFCGAKPACYEDEHEVYVQCDECSARSPNFLPTDEGERLAHAAWNRRDTTAVQREREECAKVLDGFEQEFLSRAEESIRRNNPASARFEKSRALELKSYAAAIRRRGE